MDNILLVDIFDNELGYAPKLPTHEKGLLHRAFSVFIFADNKMLLQRRKEDKYHSGGLLTNTCCSHQREGEQLDESVKRRLQEEMGITAETEELFSFIYHAEFADGLIEYELDHVFVGEYAGEVVPDPEEVSEVLWVDVDELAEDMCRHPQKYSVWFLTAAPCVLKYLKNNRGDKIQVK